MVLVLYRWLIRVQIRMVLSFLFVQQSKHKTVKYFLIHNLFNFQFLTEQIG